MAGPSIPPNLHRFLNPPSPSPPFSSLHTQASTMEKTLQDPLETNLEEWEFLPDNTSFLQFGLDEIEDLTSNEIIYADYFREEPKLIKQAQAHNQEEESQFKDISISHVFLKMINPKVDEELIERTIPSSEPKQSIAELVVREIEAPPSVFLMEEKVILGEKGDLEEEEEKEEEEKAIWEGIGFGIWRWRLIGVGALFSIGAAAAATICVVVLGGREANQSPCRRRHPSNIVQFHFQDEDEERRGMASRRSIDNVAEELKSLSLRSTTGGGGGEILEEEEDEAVRFANVRRKDFKRLERVRGRLINILEGLELHTGVFSVAEQRRIVDCIYDIQEKGRKGRLRASLFGSARVSEREIGGERGDPYRRWSIQGRSTVERA